MHGCRDIRTDEERHDKADTYRRPQEGVDASFLQSKHVGPRQIEASLPVALAHFVAERQVPDEPALLTDLVHNVVAGIDAEARR